MANPAAPWEDDPIISAPAAPARAPTNPKVSTVPNPWEGDPIVSAPTARTPAIPTAQPPAAPSAAAPSERGFFAKLKGAYTGEGRIDPAYKDAPEFLEAQLMAGEKGKPAMADPSAVMRSGIASSEAGQLDILKKNIPNLQVQRDARGNLMLKTPEMKDWAYLNKPGLSKRDWDEFTTQTLATLPFTGLAGGGSSTLARVGLGAAGMGAASVAQDALAGAAGSEQGIDPTKAAISAGIGAALPGVVEPALQGAMTLGRAAAAAPARTVRGIFNPNAQATRDVNAAIAADRAFPRGTPLSAQDVRNAGRAGQDLRVIDTGGEATRALSRSAANQSPEARSMIGNLIDERLEGQSTRTESFIRNLVQRPGQPGGPNAYATREALETAARSARKPLYDSAYAQGRNGLMSPILTKLQAAPAMESAMRAAAGTLRNRAAAAGGRTTGMRGPNGFTLEFWDMVKRQLDDQISVLKRQGAKSAAMDLDQLRRPLVAELDRMVPDFSRARGTAQTFFKATDALDAGEKFVNGRFDIGAARNALSRMTQQERDLFAEGFASRFVQQVRRVGDRRSLLNSINNSPDARERLTIALGPNRARQLEGFLRVEGIMDLVRQAQGNSTTARQLVELGLIGGGFYSGEEEGGLLALALTMGNRAIQRRIAQRVAEQLLSSNPAQVQNALRQVASTPMMDSLRAFDRLMVRTGVAQQGAAETAPAPTPPAPTNAPTPRPAANAPQATEAQRLAQAAIAQGADPAAVQKRLDAYLKANNLTV